MTERVTTIFRLLAGFAAVGIGHSLALTCKRFWQLRKALFPVEARVWALGRAGKSRLRL